MKFWIIITHTQTFISSSCKTCRCFEPVRFLQNNVDEICVFTSLDSELSYLLKATCCFYSLTSDRSNVFFFNYIIVCDFTFCNFLLYFETIWKHKHVLSVCISHQMIRYRMGCTSFNIFVIYIFSPKPILPPKQIYANKFFMNMGHNGALLLKGASRF